MSKVAGKLATAPPSGSRVKRGPSSSCYGLYEADLEDARAIEEFRQRPGESWATAHVMCDQLAGIVRKIPTDKFRYHWRRRCWCWPDDQRVT